MVCLSCLVLSFLIIRVTKSWILPFRLCLCVGLLLFWVVLLRHLLVFVAATNKSKETSPSSAQSLPAARNIIEDMPCVSTTGDGPNGKKIDGFLYRYMKGQEVRIVCVCHGSFLSPAEFVKHAGGRDVAHPLKHIVVNSSPFLWPLWSPCDNFCGCLPHCCNVSEQMLRILISWGV